VDGWALTLLPREHAGYASFCNTIGQSLGYCIGYILFLALNSSDFCNNYLRSSPQDSGILKLPDFLYFWGLVFLSSAVIVYFVAEYPPDADVSKENTISIADTYRYILQIVKLPCVLTLGGVMLTCRMGFAATDSLTHLKLLERGLPQGTLALFSTILLPLSVLWPILFAPCTNGPEPISLWLKVYPWRLIINVISSCIVFLSQDLANCSPIHSALLLVVSIAATIPAVAMFAAQMSFFARISDPAFGATYMTFLNTLTNLGNAWPQTLALASVDSLHITNSFSLAPLDGYHVLNFLCTLMGFLWLGVTRKHLSSLQALPLAAWQPPRSKKSACA